MKGAITVFMTLLFGMILSLVLVTIENVRFLTGESYARLSAKGALHAVFGEYNRELYEDYGLFGYGGYSQKNQDELSRNIERQLQTALDSRIRQRLPQILTYIVSMTFPAQLRT